MENFNIKQITWDLSPLFASDDDPKIEEKKQILQKENYAFINKWKDRDDYLKDPAVLKEASDGYELLLRNFGVEGGIGYYFGLRLSEDENNPNLKAKYNQINDFSVKILNDIQFFALRIAKIPEAEQAKFLNHEGLKAYKHWLERLFIEAKYLLSEPEEKILNLKAMPAHSNWVHMTSSFLSKEEREVLAEDGNKGAQNFSSIMSLINSTDKSVRDASAEALNDIFKKYVEVAEVELNSVLQNKKIDDELRKMPRPDLGRHIADDIESPVVDALIQAVSGKFDIAKRFYKLKAKLFRVSKLAYHERNVPYGKIDAKYSYPDTCSLILDTLLGVDQKFADIFKRFVENAQIDVFPKKGKRSGAYCADNLLINPTYIFLNHTEKLQDVLTLAHEFGHGANNELIKEKQNALNHETPLSTAEVASTFMEDFVLEKILENADDELRLAIMMMKLNDDVSTIFRQVAAYRFEQELHAMFREKGYLSKEEIGAIFQKHMASYMGEYVEQSAGSENWWVYWSHIRAFFYVYSYASGLLISKSLQNAVKQDKAFTLKVKEFLSAGSSDSPKNIFMNLGIDISQADFWGKGLTEVETLLNETEALAKKLGKLSA